MMLIRRLLFLLLIWLSIGVGALALGIPLTPATATDGIYIYRQWHDPDGIGKFYQGREIAQVMGHQGLLWLERPSRMFEEAPDRAIAALNLPPDAVVADIGAGSGYLSFRLTYQVPKGKVWAVDVQPEMLDYLKFQQQALGIKNIETVLGTERDPHLPPESIDLVLLTDAYHEFAYPYEMMTQIRAALKPGGRVVLLEYRREDPLVLIKTLYKMSDRQARRELAAVGFTWVETAEFLPQQHFLVFER
ncbi:MAG: class I SAM-dependent methyltransferase [Spirulina sp. SIO3F2]|nr:class I SAM-dependent methyltransferase [Spirulina sp. SIO3F2]